MFHLTEQIVEENNIKSTHEDTEFGVRELDEDVANQNQNLPTLKHYYDNNRAANIYIHILLPTRHYFDCVLLGMNACSIPGYL